MAGSVNFVVLGRQETAADLGKRGTATDIALYDRKEAGVIRTWAAPAGFPDKIQPLFQAINMSEYAIFHADALDRFAGEQIVALDLLGVRGGVLSHTHDVDGDRLESMIRGTVLAGYERAEQDRIREAADRLAPVPSGGPATVDVDQCFDVRGVGTVVLGRVARGTVRQYDSLKLYPGGHDVLVKSIQMHDDPVSEASSPARVGLAVKGIRPEQAGRGDVICAEGEADVRGEIELDYAKSPFYKGEVSAGQGCLVSIGLQVRAARISSVSPFGLVFDRPVVCREGGVAAVLRPESQPIRILGGGPLR